MCRLCKCEMSYWEVGAVIMESTYHFFTSSPAVRTAVPSITAARIPIIVNVAELMVMFKNNILVKYFGWI